MRRWLIARIPLLLVGIVPALLLALGVARFTLNHFFARPPYLLDSGLLSGVVYRSGWDLAPPGIACDYATSFYQVYFSPIISAFSALSYVIPVRRIEWFTFIEALVYLPIGFVVYSVVSQTEVATRQRRLPVAFLAALAFSCSGIVLWMIGYPHYEAATPALICLALCAVVTGRTRMTWIMIALAAGVRQDGGLHVALAFSPLVYLKWRGVEMPVSMRRLLATMAIAIAASVVGFALQRLLWAPVDRMTPVYFGSPKYAHLTWDLIAERVQNFGTDCQLIYYPFLATVALAAVRRDARYLLGWATTIPWFLFNFTAYDDAKSTFSAYTAGPFLIGMFWVYLYGAQLAPVARRLRPGMLEAVFLVICLLSTVGAVRGRPRVVERTARDMAFLQAMDRENVHGFADALLEHKADFGHIYVDDAVAALVQEGFGLAEHWSFRGTWVADALAFHGVGSGITLLPLLALAELDACVHATATHLYVCTRTPPPAAAFAKVPFQRMPAMFAFTRIDRPGVLADEQGVKILPGFSLQGSLGDLPRGRYEATLRFAGAARLRLEARYADVVEAAGTGTVSVTLETDGERGVSYRVTALGTEPIVITGGTLRPLAPAPAGR